MPSRSLHFSQKYIFCLLLSLGNLSSFAQHLLQKRISLSIQQKPLKEVLAQIENKANIYFSYNSDLLNEQKQVSINAQDQPLEAVLADVLGTGYRFQESGDHVIIKLAAGQGIIFSGKLIEAETGQPIEYASVYEKSLMAGTTTDAEGNFNLQIRQPMPQYELVIKKLSYEDTMLTLKKNYTPDEPITLKRSVAELPEVTVRGVEQHWLAKRLISTKDKFNSINLRGYFARQPYQFSLFPGLGSKDRLKGQTVNKFSFNVIGGYTGGVRGFELGTGFNIVQRDMQYVQIGGLFNIVGGKMQGVQVGGIYNYVDQSARGVQFAGIYNNAAQLRGVQASGAVSWIRENVYGVQASGILNKASNTDGVQFAGFGNWNEKKLEGFQAAGAFNSNDSLEGVQCAGLLNYTRTRTEGAQIAGGFNVTRRSMNGLQIAGLLNYAETVNGTQLGLINIADSSSGLSLGLINIILKGKHSLDLSVMEWQPFALSYRSGTDRLFNIFQVGGDPFPGNKLLSIGYGVGVASPVAKRWQLVNEITAHTIHAGNWNDQHIMGRYQLLLEYRPHPDIRFYLGPALSLLYYENTNTYEGFRVPFQTTYPGFDINPHMKGWIGWTLGISCF